MTTISGHPIPIANLASVSQFSVPYVNSDGNQDGEFMLTIMGEYHNIESNTNGLSPEDIIEQMNRQSQTRNRRTTIVYELGDPEEQVNAGRQIPYSNNLRNINDRFRGNGNVIQTLIDYRPNTWGRDDYLNISLKSRCSTENLFAGETYDSLDEIINNAQFAINDLVSGEYSPYLERSVQVFAEEAARAKSILEDMKKQNQTFICDDNLRNSLTNLQVLTFDIHVLYHIHRNQQINGLQYFSDMVVICGESHAMNIRNYLRLQPTIREFNYVKLANIVGVPGNYQTSVSNSRADIYTEIPPPPPPSQPSQADILASGRSLLSMFGIGGNTTYNFLFR